MIQTRRAPYTTHPGLRGSAAASLTRATPSCFGADVSAVVTDARALGLGVVRWIVFGLADPAGSARAAGFFAAGLGTGSGSDTAAGCGAGASGGGGGGGCGRGGGGGGGFTEGAGAGSGVGTGAGSGATAGVRAVDTAFVCNLPLIPARAGWARTGRVAAEKEPATMIPSHREIVGLLALRRCDRASVGPNPAPPDGRGTWRRPAYHAGSANTRGRDPRARARGGSRDR